MKEGVLRALGGILAWCVFMGAGWLTPGTVQAQTEIRVGLASGYPPFSSVNRQGQPTGFDADMASALCQVMQRPCQFVMLPLDRVIADMAQGELDVAFGVDSTEKARASMDFSDAYFQTRSTFIGRGDLKLTEGQHIVGVRQGSAQEEYLRQNKTPHFSIVSGSHVDMLEKLQAGKVDVVLGNNLAVYDFLKTDCGIAFASLGSVLPVDAIPSTVRIGVRKRADGLRKDINNALMTLRYNGEFIRINRQYFPYQLY